ncbi:hypothetical protein SKC37_02110 [Aquirufa sp. HETE-83D]|uniref:Bacterial Pleckstrin homology domain-containing protein n=1 Tax=Aquirufa esocilacus TaxID=3096513 RepID=A0ABW6DFH0_9BACT
MYTETQRFTQWWLWLILIGSWITMMYSIATVSPPTTISFLISFVIGMLLPVLCWQMKLTTRISAEGIFVRFFPFHFKEKFFAWDTLSASYVRTYSPLMEYGGWGIKYSFKGNGLVYNTSGNVGLQLYFKEGDPILIGTQKGEEIKQVLVALGHLNESVK